ncbi:MAG: DoxX family protein, partial [Mycobacterium sp.]|nr:DoxX family protein [Mycobacterium sp.]
MLIRRIARPMLASVFVASGVTALRHPEQFADTARPFVKKSQDTLPDDITDPLPDDAETWVRVNAAVQVGGGVLLATGKIPRIAALALAGSLVPTTVAGHDFWNESDPEARNAALIHFLKNVSLLGGLLITAVDTEGKPSVAYRGRKAAEHAADAVGSANPFSGDDDRFDHLKSIAAERAGHFAEVARDRAPVV